ncbi:MAG: RHS repeat protein, partial [Gammaproteobacteria bacterium]|nr:RHS repeat protein [Gammaproteobacteria bacterium]
RNNGVATYQYDPLGRLTSDVNPENGGWTLNRANTSNGYAVDMSSAEGRSTVYQVDSLPTGDFQRTLTSPDGSISTSLEKPNGETVATQPNGTITTIQQGSDPRFGMLAPVDISNTVATPSGLTSTVTNDNTATLADRGNPLSMTALLNTKTTNGRISTQAYDASTLTWTDTSAESRVETVQINAQGQPVLSQITDLNSASYSYDTRGRLEIITEGTGLDQRITTLEFYPTPGPMAGFLKSITDAENQVTTFEYDVVGRVTKQILPDLREITYGYDANGNLTSLTPPGRPAHVFIYNGVDQEEQYTPPAVTGITAPQTGYTYNLDEQLTK